VPEGSFNIGRLVAQLGLKNVRELPIAENIQPVMIAGQGGDLVAPLIPPQAWAGREIIAVIGEHAAIQLQVFGTGGAYVDVYFGRFRGAGEIEFRLRIDPGDPLVVDPLGIASQTFNTGPVNVSSLFLSGTTTVAASSLIPAFAASSSSAAPLPGVLGIFVPNGFRLTIQCDSPNESANFALFWKEVPPNLSPTG